MRNIVTKQESLVKDGQWDTNPKNMLKSSLLLERFKNSIYYSQNNQPFRKETETKMVVKISVKIPVTMVAAHGK